MALGLTAILLLAAQDPPATPAPDSPWRAFGRVTDAEGRPLAGVEVSASCGMGSLRRTGSATTGEDGRYDLRFGPGYLSDDPISLQAATISAHKAGMFERNLSRQGGCRAAFGRPDPERLAGWGGGDERLVLPDRPIELDFVMLPAARVAGQVVDEHDRPLPGYSVSLDGADLPPSSSVVAYTVADDQGRFVLDDLPTTFRYQLVVRKANPKPPWDDSWASAALRFEPPGSADLHAMFGDRAIRVERLTLRVAGPGRHDRTATPLAGNRGVLDLTSNDPPDRIERTASLLAAPSATLTLRNEPGDAPGGSLVPESVPAPLANPSPTRLARTRPDADGSLVVSFQNPPGAKLEAGKHQVVFQVFVGASQKPIHEKIFRQLDIQTGRYEVPVRIDPRWLDDSRVSIAFVTIQPDHEAWVRAFFHEGRGTSYKGMWVEDSALLPAMAYADARP
jgi:hypothetical protein